MSIKTPARRFRAFAWLKMPVCVWRFATLSAIVLILDSTSIRAAILTMGDVVRLSGWSTAYVGQSSSGTVTVNAGSTLQSWNEYLGYESSADGTATITGTGSKWTTSYLDVGHSGSGTLNIENGGKQIVDFRAHLGYNAGSAGTVTVKDANSAFVCNNDLLIGTAGTGSLVIQGGGQAMAETCSLGTHGDVTVSGAGSKWTISYGLYMTNSSGGMLTVANGGEVIVTTLRGSVDHLLGDGVVTAHGAILDDDVYFDSEQGSQPTLAFGSGGRLNLLVNNTGHLGAGWRGSGTIRIADGITVSSGYGYLGHQTGSSGTATVTGNGSTWSNTDGLYVGYHGQGILTIESGGKVVSGSAALGALGNGEVNVTGIGSALNVGSLSIGQFGNGNLTVTDGATASIGDLDASWSGSSVTVTNGGAIAVNTVYASLDKLHGDGNITAHGAVLDTAINFDNAHGSQPSFAFGTGGSLNLVMDGTGDLGAGLHNFGSIRIADGMIVTSHGGCLGKNAGATGVATVAGAGSKWIVGNTLEVGSFGNGTLNIGNETESGGLVTAKTVLLTQANAGSGTTGICTINHGGILQVGTIASGHGTSRLEWNDGTIRNYDLTTDLYISVGIKLAEAGTHVIEIDSGRSGAISAPVSDATTNGTLTKTGGGTLLLSGTNTYTGTTTVEAGTLRYSTVGAMTSGPYSVSGGTLDIGTFAKSIGVFRITGGTVNGTGTLTSNAAYDIQAGTVNARLVGTVGLNKTGVGLAVLAGANTYGGATTVSDGTLKVAGSILNTSGVTVGELGILELAKASGSATAANVPIENDGLVVVSVGSQTVGTIVGSGTTQVNASASLTAVSIVQDSLIVGGSAAAAGAADAPAVNAVPEPGTLVLLVMSGLGAIAIARNRTRHRP